MSTELSLEGVAADVEIWRQTKKYKTAPLPQEIDSNIRKLLKCHKKSDIVKALKINDSTIRKAIKRDSRPTRFPKIPPRNRTVKQPRKIYNLEEKQALCDQWRRSGIGLDEFSKAKKISKSALYQWSRRYPQPVNKEQNWIPVNMAQEPEVLLEKTVLIELLLPNESRIKILRTEAAIFFQELYHAIAAVR